MSGNYILWSSKWQPTVSRSIAKAKYRAVASTTIELTWIIYLYWEIGIPLAQPPQILSDNLSALHMTINPIFHAQPKHIELDYHFIREKVVDGALVTKFVLSPLQIARCFYLAFIKCHLPTWEGMLSMLIKITKRKVINGQINNGFISSHNLLKSKLFVKEYLQQNFKIECQ